VRVSKPVLSLSQHGLTRRQDADSGHSCGFYGVFGVSLSGLAHFA